MIAAIASVHTAHSALQAAVSPDPPATMSASGGGRATPVAGRKDRRSDNREPGVTDLMRNLSLTAEEEEIAAMSDEEGEEEVAPVAALIGKVLSPTALHASTILGATHMD